MLTFVLTEMVMTCVVYMHTWYLYVMSIVAVSVFKRTMPVDGVSIIKFAVELQHFVRTKQISFR